MYYILELQDKSTKRNKISSTREYSGYGKEGLLDFVNKCIVDHEILSYTMWYYTDNIKYELVNKTSCTNPITSGAILYIEIENLKE